MSSWHFSHLKYPDPKELVTGIHLWNPSCLRQYKHERRNEEEDIYTLNESAESSKVLSSEDVSIPDDVVAEMGVYEPKEVSELVEASEAELVSQPEEVTDLVEAGEADLDPKPEDISELIKVNETEEASKQQENFEQKPRQENVSLWRRFKKSMTPSCMRQYKDKKKNQGQM